MLSLARTSSVFLTLPFPLSLDSAPVRWQSLLIFLFLNAVVIFNAYLWTRFYFQKREILDFLITLSLLSLAQIIIILTFLGTVGRLRLAYIGGANLGALLASVFILRKRLKRPAWPDFKIQGHEKGDIFFSYLFTLVLVVLSLAAVFMITAPPSSWHVLNYGLSFSAAWMRSGRIEVVPFTFGFTAPYAPSNIQLFYLYLLAPLGSDLLAKAGQVPFLILGALSLYGIARRLGISRSASRYVPLLFLITPEILRQSVSPEIDIPGASLLYTTLYLWLDWLESRKTKALFLSSLSLGIFLGARYAILIYSPLIILPFLGSIFLPARPGRRWRPLKSCRCLLNLAIFLAGTSLCSIFWYLRNWALTGSPLYPVSVRIFGSTLMRGAYSVGVLRDSVQAAAWYQGGLGGLVRLLNASFGLPLVILAIVSCILASVFCARREFEMKRVYIFILPLLIASAFWYLSPSNLEGRYILAAVGLAYIPLAYSLERSGRRSWVVKSSALFLLLWAIFPVKSTINLGRFTLKTNHLVNSSCAKILFLLSIGLFILLLLLKRLFSRRNRRLVYLYCLFIPLVFIISSVIFFPEIIFRPPEGLSRHQSLLCRLFSDRASGKDRDWPLRLELFQEPSFLLAWDWIINHTHGDKIAYVGHNLPYYLYGRDFKNDVYYVNIDSHLDWKYHNYELAQRNKPLYFPWDVEPAYHRINPDLDGWLRNLRALGIDYLFIYVVQEHARKYFWTDEEGFPIEEKWAREERGIFERVFMSRYSRIYKLHLSGSRETEG